MNNNVLNKIDIVDVVKKYENLQKRGNNYICLCPFHPDKHPSMSVSGNKQIFKCFSCGASGNAINFVMQKEKITYTKALEMLNKWYNLGLTITNYFPEKKYTIQQKKLLEINLKVLNYAQYFLANNEQIGEYLVKNRNLTKDTISEFKLGYLKGNDLIHFLINSGFKQEDILLTGVALEKENQLYPFFRERIIIPIFSENDQVIGFAGRIIKNNSEQIKYLNIANSLVFQKNETFFNLNNAKDSILEAKYAILTEGYMDTISLHQAHYKNTIAIMGTNLSNIQIQKLKKVTKTIILALDNDEPGKMAAQKIGRLLIKNYFKVYVLKLNKFKDIDEYLRHNTEKFNIKQCVEEFSFFWLKNLDNNLSLEQLEEFIQNTISSFSKFSSIKQKLFLTELSQKANQEPNILKTLYQSNYSDFSYSPQAEKTQKTHKTKEKSYISHKQRLIKNIDQLEKEYITTMLINIDWFEFLKQKMVFEVNKSIVKKIETYHHSKTKSLEQFNDLNPYIKNKLETFLQNQEYSYEVPENYYHDFQKRLIKTIKYYIKYLIAKQTEINTNLWNLQKIIHVFNLKQINFDKLNQIYTSYLKIIEKENFQ